MTDDDKEPIDLLKWRFDKLQERKRRRERTEDAVKELEWSGTELADEIEAIDLSQDVLKGVRTFLFTIARRVKEASSIRDVERLFFGLGLLLLRDYDDVAFDKFLKMMQEDVEKK